MDDQSAVTKADLQSLATKQDLTILEQAMNKGFKKVHEDVNLVLDVLINVDKKYKKKTENYEQRLLRLEKSVA